MSNDQIGPNKKVFFIRHPEGALEGIEKFLKNRDFKVESASDLKEAFASILKSQPNYVFICLDHPNEKVHAIPKLLLQSLLVTVIPYVNGTSIASIRMIQNTNAEYKLFPPNSGPSTLRLLNKILKDQARGNNSSEANKKDSGQIINASRSQVNDSKIYRIDGNDPNSSTWSTKQNGFGGKNSDEIVISSQKGQSQNYIISGGQGLQDPEFANASQADKFAAFSSFLNGDAQNPVHSNSAPMAESSSGSLSTPSPSQDSFSQTPAIPFQKTRSVPTRFGKNRNPTDFEAGAEEALNQLAVYSSKELDYKRVDKVSNATCFAIDSNRFTGYLVAVFAGKKKIDFHFLNLIKLRLKEFLISRGDDFDPSEKMDIQIVEVDFEAWAIEQAEFLKKSVHQGNEMAMAFFPTQHPRIAILPSADKEMLKVSIDDIDENRAVKFNLYIYLAMNRKYILYTPKGGRLASEQKTRLKKKGVADVHFHKNDAHDFKTYQAEKYLNGKITEFHEKEQVKNSETPQTETPAHTAALKKAA